MNSQKDSDEDMAAVGRSLMAAIEVHASPGWHCADCPSEIVGDLRNECDELTHQRDLLASAIRDAAVKVGIVQADTDLTGPHLLMLCNDLAESALSNKSA